MPRKPPTPQRGKTAVRKPPRTAANSEKAPLTEAEKTFRDRLKLCLPQERDFIRYKLQGLNNTESAKRAGYSEKTAEEQGARLLGRVRVRDAYYAGLDALGFGADDIRADIRALRDFDPSTVEREIKEVETVLVERRADDVIQELITKERAVQEFIDGLDVDDESLIESFKKRLGRLLHDRLELEMEVAVNPDATTHVSVPQLVSRWVVDEHKIRELGLGKFIKSRRMTKFGWAYEFYSWVDGVQMAAKATGLFVERREVSGPGGKPIEAAMDTSNMSPTQLAEAYRTLLTGPVVGDDTS